MLIMMAMTNSDDVMIITRMVMTLTVNKSTVDESGCIICNVLAIHSLQFTCIYTRMDYGTYEGKQCNTN